MLRCLASIVVVVGTLAGCGDIYRYYKSGPVSWALKREVRDNYAQRIVLSDLTRFAWDELFLFGPYQPKSMVCATLGIGEMQCESRILVTSVDDGEMLIAFRKSGALVHSELHYRWHGDFTPLPSVQPIPLSRATFRVVPEGRAAGGGAWLKLVLE